ncbi:flavin-dependent monooxygenase, oxygenase subunit HsaA-like [Ylistrum balloti]|uniref:flavin-dependent monooxygenase, oxygenase subunit HsaA-like n=1 Tax=Ylistrum balloti TaxID=509963 RepID=UPI002905BF14|nr:flavin-dependent monooxygenase, oxygenase subunit HsaA-like [Ylistrum balloti]
MAVAAHTLNIPTHDELVSRARDLAPKLKERAEAAEAARCVPEQTVAEMQEAGFFQVLQPKKWGGYECEPRTFFDIQMELARACPSTAWIYGVIGIHQWQMALFPEETQQEVWGEDPRVLISSSYMPVGKVEHTDGGVILSGRWGFSSGCDHCQWVFVGGFIPPKDGEGYPDMVTFLVPRSDYDFDDDWHVSGLKATGSKTVIVDKKFVPWRRIHKFSDGFKQDSPGHAVNDAPLFRLPFGQIFVRAVSTGTIGMLQGALDTYIEVQKDRVQRGNGEAVSQQANAQQAVAHAAATIDMLKLILYRSFDEMMDYVRRGEKIPVERRVHFRYQSALVVESCLEAATKLLNESGGSGIFLTNPINSYFQDIRAARGHYANNMDKPGKNLGSVLMGLKNTDFFI